MMIREPIVINSQFKNLMHTVLVDGSHIVQ